MFKLEQYSKSKNCVVDTLHSLNLLTVLASPPHQSWGFGQGNSRYYCN